MNGPTAPERPASRGAARVTSARQPRPRGRPVAGTAPHGTERRGRAARAARPATPAWPPFCGSGCLLAAAIFLAAGAGLRLLGAESVGDALVGGISLPVDAVRVDLQQDGDAVPGAAATSVAGTPELSHSETAACRRS